MIADRGYKRLIVYQRMLAFVVLTYGLVGELPKEERFGLVDQMRRAVVSVISNFAEGYAKKSIKEKQHFMEMADASLSELEAQADVCLALGYWKRSEYERFLEKKGEVGYLLHRYRLQIK